MKKDYKEGDILVSEYDTSNGRQNGDIILMLNKITYKYGKYNNTQIFDSAASYLRYATPTEIEHYNKGIRNIKDIPKEINMLQNLELW